MSIISYGNWANRAAQRSSEFSLIYCFHLLAFVACCGPAFADEPAKVTYNDHVLPIFREHCMACHDSGGRSGDLSLESYGDTLTGGASGEVVEPGVGDASRLYQLMAHLEEPIMPPGQDKLPDEQLAVVKAWIDGGLLENAGSKAKKSKRSAVAAFVPSADNRPTGDPAMPGGFFREPVLHIDTPSAVGDLAASPWAPLVAITGQRQVLLYHAESRELLAVVPFVVGQPEVVRFSRNGDLLLVAGGRGATLGVVHLWDIKSGTRISEIGDELDTVLAADLSSDHTLLAFGGPRKRVQVHRTADGELAYSITKHTDWVTALEFSPDGTLLVTADRSGNAELWEAKTGRPVATMAGHKGTITAVAWRGDSQLVATAGDAGEIRTWQRNGTQVKQWRGGPGMLDARFTKDGRLVTVGRDNVAKLWNTEGNELKVLGKSDDIALAIAPVLEDRGAVFADWTGTVRQVELETGKELGRLPANPPTLAMRLETAEQAVRELGSKVQPATEALAAATTTLEGAMATLEEHQQAKRTAETSMSELQKGLVEAQNELNQQKQQLGSTDQAIVKVKEQQQAEEAKLNQLHEQLASIGDQEGEEADGQAAAELESQIAECESALDALRTKRQETEAQRSKLDQARNAARENVDQLQRDITSQKQELTSLEEAEKNLPNVEALRAERDRLLKELEMRKVAKNQAEQLVARLQTEITGYAAAGSKLEQSLVEKRQSADATSAELAEVADQLEIEDQQVSKLEAEIESLRQQMEKLEIRRRRLSEALNQTKESADQLEQQLGELSAEREKFDRAVSDYQQAAELRQQLIQGN